MAVPLSARITPPPALEYFAPRWSPDNRSIAFVANEAHNSHVLYVCDSIAGKPRAVARALRIKGIAWLPDSSALVYASSAGNTLMYPPVFHLRTVPRSGGRETQLTPGDDSYVDPDIVQAGKLYASRVRIESDIWSFENAGSPAQNMKTRTRITQQTGQVQTPSVSPDGKQIAYLSDSGGHGNIWVVKVDGSDRRQVTFEPDPDVTVGLPVWSPTENWIVFIKTRLGLSNSEWIIRSDGSGERLLIEGGSSAAWSADGRWVYYQKYYPPDSCIYRILVTENASEERVLCDAAVPALSQDALYYSPHGPGNGHEIFKVSLQGGEGTFLTRHAASRTPIWPTGRVVSPDGRWLAVPLKDGGTTNIWAIATDTDKPDYRQITDFGRQAILIARQVSWSRDGKLIYAAVAETDADIVLLDSATVSRESNRPPR